MGSTLLVHLFELFNFYSLTLDVQVFKFSFRIIKLLLCIVGKLSASSDLNLFQPCACQKALTEKQGQ